MNPQELFCFLFEMKLDAQKVMELKKGKNSGKNKVLNQAKGAIKAIDFIVERFNLLDEYE